MDTENENERFLRAAKEADRGQLRTAARLLRGFKAPHGSRSDYAALTKRMMPHRNGRTLHSRRLHIPRRVTSDSNTYSRTSAMQEDRRTQAVEKETATFQLSWCRNGDNCELRLQAKVIGGDRGGGKARPIVFEEMLLKLVTSSILRAHVSQVRRAAGSCPFGINHEGGAPEIAWKIDAKMAALPAKGFIASDIRNGFGAARRGDAVEAARLWCRWWVRSLPTCGQEKKKCNQQLRRTRRKAASQSRWEMGFCKAHAKRRWHLLFLCEWRRRTSKTR